MKRLVLVLVVACSTSSRTTHPDPVATASHTTPEAGPIASADASAPAPSQEMQDALHALESEHPNDVPSKAWWKAHAAEARPYLRAMLDDGTDDGQADSWAIRILGDLGEDADVATLAKVLQWKSETTRMEAASALGVHPAATAGQALIVATHDTNADTVGYAASALGSRKQDPDARKRLEELLDHTESSVRYRAVNALAALGGSKEALAKRKKLEQDADVKAAIAKALKAR